MRKLTALAVGGILVAGMAMAQSNVVTSVNAVGYQTFQIPGNASALVRVDFEKMDATPWLASEIFGTNYAYDVIVYYWDPVSGGWLNETFLAGFGFWDPGTTQFGRGDSLFVSMQGDASTTNTITIAGEVPGTLNGASQAVLPLAPGFNGVAYSYPAAIALTNTTLAASANGEDLTVYYWNNGWLSATYLASFDMWDPDNIVLEPGVGYLIYKTAAGTTNWTEGKPYSWP